MKRHATFQTDCAHRYLLALCRHFGRSLDAKHGANSGWVNFPNGRSEFRADAGALSLAVTADARADLYQLTDIVTSHLERFAFREAPELRWQASPVETPEAVSRAKSTYTEENQ